MTRLQGLLAQLPKLDIPLPYTKFTLFPELPTELRNKIWKCAAMVSRDINLEYKDYYACSDHQPVTPAILHTSSEARSEAKRYYTLCPVLCVPLIPGENRLKGAQKSPSIWIWINFAVDRFVWSQPVIPPILQGLPLMPVETNVLCFVIGDMGKIQHLCLDFYAESFNTDQFLLFLREMTRLLHLESLDQLTVKAANWIVQKGGDNNLLAMDMELNGMVASIQNAVLQEQEEAERELPFHVEIRHILAEPSYTMIWDSSDRYEITRK